MKSAALAGILAMAGTSFAGKSYYRGSMSALKKLDKAGYIMHGTKDAYALQNILDVKSKEMRTQFDDLEDFLADRGYYEDLKSVQHLRELLKLASLEIVELSPESTGVGNASDPLGGLNDGLPDGDLTPGFPSGASLVSQAPSYRYSGGYKGNELWTRDYVDADGREHHDEQVRSPFPREVIRELNSVHDPSTGATKTRIT